MSINKETKDRLLKELIEDEGYRQFAYRDSVGKLTIGIGRNLDSKGISKQEAIMMAENDIEYVYEKLMIQLPFFNDLDEVRKSVLLNMAFNMGIIGLMTFKKFLNLISIKNYQAASIEMLNSKWAKQVGDRDLELSRQMRTGEW